MRILPAALARIDRFVRRSIIGYFPPQFATRFYSHTREHFLKMLATVQPPVFIPPEHCNAECWGIRFQFPLFNAAGMFKNADGYSFCARMGAGAYLAGTVTRYPRYGNRRKGIRCPFLPYPRSAAASNWLGLPNLGYQVIARRIASIAKIPGCPIGISLAVPAELRGEAALAEYVAGLRLFESLETVDFIELNESCPNTEAEKEEWEQLWNRLEYIHHHFIRNRKRFVPLIVKFSNDLPITRVSSTIERLCDLQYDGVNFGNTSVQYSLHRTRIHPREQKYYDYFITNFGGGVSGMPLQNESLLRCKEAVRYLQAHPPAHEFHIIRTGGIFTADDVRESLNSGISLCQWYTGFFEQFALWSYRVYQKIAEQLSSEH